MSHRSNTCIRLVLPVPVRNNGDCGESWFRNYHTNEFFLLKNAPRLLEDPNEGIINLWSCKSSIFLNTNVIPRVCHSFIVVKTNSGFWSFEKFDTGITGQFAKQFDGVSNVSLNGEKNGEIIKKYDVKGYKISDVFTYIIDVECYIPYKVTPTYYNCQGFNKRLINKFGVIKNKDWAESWFLNYHTKDKVLLENVPLLLDDPMEVIINLWLCKSPLKYIPEVFFNHTFIVVNTNSGFWSFEKVGYSISAQFAKQFDGVSNVFLNVERKGNIIKKYDVKGYNISDIFKYIIDKEIYIPYNAINEHNNCQGFHTRLINKFVRN